MQVMRTSLLAATAILAEIAFVWGDQPSKSHDKESIAAEKPAELSKHALSQAVLQAELKNDKQKSSYTLGYTVGMRMRRQFGVSDLESLSFLRGLWDAIGGRSPIVPRAQAEESLTRFKSELDAKRKKKDETAAEDNKKRGEEFLAKNKSKEGVHTLPSGIQYLVLKEGTGKKPKADDTVNVHYHGTLIGGAVFDSSVDRGEPTSFGLSGVIPGWTEVMKEGSKWRVFIPPELAYGANGNGTIGPNETLIFEIELLKVE
jgi:FKBP-type peptidyl-prolyl cis-trans isomerase FklB